MIACFSLLPGILASFHMIHLSMIVEAGMANSKTEALINKEVDDLIDKGHVTEQDLRVINLSSVCVSPCGATLCHGSI